MVSNPYDGDGWRAKMAESMVLTASLNYFADHEPHAMIEYLSAKMFASEGSKTMSAAERNRQFRLTIAVKFMQGWRLEPGMQKFFPDWVQIAKPVGIFDYRSKDGGASMFLQQLRDSEFEWMLLPSAHAGPDLRYSVFFCSVKTTTANSTSANDYQTITEVAVPANWYKSDPAMNAQCSKELQVTGMKTRFEPGSEGEDEVIRVNLDSKFAAAFFGKRFVTDYKKFALSGMKR
ncbi:hypothetical protein HDU80_011177 [Chytriomyces hyalinus]|nr:hypothetical protein HDU80_011177 [Chytriomyces hyalinus]